MASRILLLLWCTLASISAQSYPCTDTAVVLVLRRLSYDFSIGITDKVKEDIEGNFVFSPLQVWVQLTALAESSSGASAAQIMKVTQYKQQLCFRRKFLRIIKSNYYDDLGLEFFRSDVLLVDREYMIVHSYKVNAEGGFNINIEPYVVNDEAFAQSLNNKITKATNGEVGDMFSADDFRRQSLNWDDAVDTNAIPPRALVVADAAYFRPLWLYPFSEKNTKVQNFFSEKDKVIGNVAMMYQKGLFNMSYIPSVKLTVLELPCGEDATSFLIFLPDSGSIENMYYELKTITLSTIYKRFTNEGEKVVNVQLPRFKIYSDYDNLREVISDMGIDLIFKENWSDFNGVKDNDLHVSLMIQTSVAEITEGDLAIYPDVPSNVQEYDFVANRPFAFMGVNTDSKIILFSGVYSNPSIY